MANSLISGISGNKSMINSVTTINQLLNSVQNDYEWGYVFVEVRYLALEIGGKALFLAIARDVSEKRNLEQQLLHSQRLEAVGRLSGGIAHDFNNLLTMVLGNAELILEDSIITDKVREK